MTSEVRYKSIIPQHNGTIINNGTITNAKNGSVDNSKGEFTGNPVGGGGTVIAPTSTIDPATATFDKYSNSNGHKDVTVTQTLRGNTLQSIQNGSTPLSNGDYTVSSDGITITITKGYLAKQPVAVTTLTFDYSAGADSTLKVTISDTTPTVTGVTVSPATTTVQKGKTEQFSATVTGTNNPATTVTWAVTGGKTGAGTSIGEDGLLRIAAGETATSLTVTATATADKNKSGTAVVTVTAVPVTKNTLTVTNGTGGGSYKAGTVVTIAAHIPATGKVFDRWTTAGGVSFADAARSTTTITMPAQDATVTATYKNAPAVPTAVTGITLNKTALSLYSNTRTKTGTLTATIAPANATNKAVTWASSNNTVATVTNGKVTAVRNGTATITATTADGGKTATCAVTVTTQTNNSGSGSDGGSSGDGSSGGDNPVVTSPSQLTSPEQVEVDVETTIDANGNLLVNVKNEDIAGAVAKVKTRANGITIVLNARGSKMVKSIHIKLPQAVQTTVINNKIVNLMVKVDNPYIKIDMDLSAMKEINRQAKTDVNLIATPLNSGKLTGNAKAAIGARLALNLTVHYGSGKQVQNFGEGRVSVTIPYTLGASESAGNVCAVYVDASGNVQWLAGSAYDSAAKVLRFSTNHFSTYAGQ